MREAKVDLSKVSHVNSFVDLTNQCDGDVIIYSERYIVNGKSLIDIYSLDLSKPLKVEFHGDIPDEVKEGMKKFIVD